MIKIKYKVTGGFGTEAVGSIVDAYIVFGSPDSGGTAALVYHPKSKGCCACMEFCVERKNYWVAVASVADCVVDHDCNYINFESQADIDKLAKNVAALKYGKEKQANKMKQVLLVRPPTDINEPKAAGCIASEKVLFGPDHRYAVYAVHTRFEASVEWVVTDAEDPDNGFTGYGRPSVIRQCATFEEAIRDLEVETL